MKTLVLRLSSMGDVVLATSFLEAPLLSGKVDWVVVSEYALLLEGHPKIDRLWRFNRSTGIKGWIQLSRELWEQRYDQVFDLHHSLRSLLLKTLFWYWSLRSGQTHPEWKIIKKERGKSIGLFMFKRFWPTQFHPSRKVEQFAKVGGGSGSERPNLKFLCQDRNQLQAPAIPFASYLCVMPSSRWKGKCWSVEKYFEVIKNLSLPVVVLGSKEDKVSHKLVQFLKESKLSHYSGVGIWNLRQVAHVLSRAEAYFGNDTGLAILAESLGIPAFVVFGPTTPEMGFGPWQSVSRSLQAPLWCRPCGKDGRACFRITDRYRCMNELKPESVLVEIKKSLLTRRPEGS